jgi:hypothetical protein
MVCSAWRRVAGEGPRVDVLRRAAVLRRAVERRVVVLRRVVRDALFG